MKISTPIVLLALLVAACRAQVHGERAVGADRGLQAGCKCDALGVTCPPGYSCQCWTSKDGTKIVDYTCWCEAREWEDCDCDVSCSDPFKLYSRGKQCQFYSCTTRK
jgi:hypothetical protein